MDFQKKCCGAFLAHSVSLNSTCSGVVGTFNLVPLFCWVKAFSEISTVFDRDFSGR